MRAYAPVAAEALVAEVRMLAAIAAERSVRKAKLRRLALQEALDGGVEGLGGRAPQGHRPELACEVLAPIERRRVVRM